MKAFDLVTKILLIVGGLNWGLVGVAKFDLVAAIFGQDSLLARVVYTVVGICAVIQIFRLAAPERSMSTAHSH